MNQSLRAGERLPPQDELAERLGVSLTVVREAVRFLMAKGLLDARKGSGVYVRRTESGLATGPQPPDRNSMMGGGLAERATWEGGIHTTGSVPQGAAGPPAKGCACSPRSAAGESSKCSTSPSALQFRIWSRG